MAGNDEDEMDAHEHGHEDRNERGHQDGEPVFNVPGVVIAVLAVLIAVHVTLSLLPEESSVWWGIALAFVPARYAGFSDQIPGGAMAAFTSPFTYMLVHANVMHLVMNSVWLLAFGAVLARRLGAARFLAFSIAGGLAGALAFYVANPELIAPVIGASGAVAAMMGAVMRFLFVAIDRGEGHLLRDAPEAVGRAPVMAALRDRRVLGASAVFIAINLFAIVGFGSVGSGAIAWQAHLGGYFFGFLAFALFDIAPRNVISGEKDPH